ncbi:MAG: hypothetical protein M3O71_00445 [Bacteroidota bacterium]|nr:hypothetical protein [Bacteroidota bacterium]
MEKLKSVNKNVSLRQKDDIIKDEDLKAKIRNQDDKVQQMLLWSTICSVWSYLVLIVVIARIYNSVHGNHPGLLIGSMVVIYVMMGILIWFAWKGMSNSSSHFYATSRSHLKYQLNKLSGQRRLITFYLIEYALLLGTSSIFFFTDISNGLPLLLRLTAPVSILTYVLGIYFVVKFTRQMKKLEIMNRQVNHAAFLKDFRQN